MPEEIPQYEVKYVALSDIADEAEALNFLREKMKPMPFRNGVWVMSKEAFRIWLLGLIEETTDVTLSMKLGRVVDRLPFDQKLHISVNE